MSREFTSCSLFPLEVCGKGSLQKGVGMLLLSHDVFRLFTKQLRLLFTKLGCATSPAL